MTNEIMTRMLDSATGLVAIVAQPIAVTTWENRGQIDFEIVMKPERPTSATISWFLLAGTFTVGVSSRWGWDSSDSIRRTGDEQADVEEGFAQSWKLVERVARSGASFVALGSPLLGPFRATAAFVNEDLPDRELTVLECWEAW